MGGKAQQWNLKVVNPEPEEIAKWTKTEIQKEGKSTKNTVPWLVLAALAKIKVITKHLRLSTPPGFGSFCEGKGREDKGEVGRYFFWS